MKSINIVKLMQEKKNLDSEIREDNTEERAYANKLKKFVDTYVVPKFKNIDLSDEEFKRDVILKAYELTALLNRDCCESNSDLTCLKKTELNFFYSNDVKLKARVGNRIAKQVVRTFTYPIRKAEYIEIYINPILKKLVNENVIVYDKNALDNKTKIANKKIDNLVSKFIDDILGHTKVFVIMERVYGEDYINEWDIIFGNNIEIKREFATIFYDYVKDNIDSIDFKNLKNINFTEEAARANLIELV